VTETLLATAKDVSLSLPMPSAIDLMAETLSDLAQGKAILPLRHVLRLPESPNAFALMPAVLGDALGAKVITVFPGNDASPYDSHIGVVLYFDMTHGRLLAILDASTVTAIRTAAVSGVATRLLALPDASDLAILGAGVQALTHLEAMRAVRPLRRVRVWSRSSERRKAFAERARRRLEIDVELTDDAQSAVQGAEIVCTVTSSRTPVLEGRWLAEGAHVNAVGSSISTARELDSRAVARSRLFVDRRESALNEAGDFLIPKGEGLFGDDHIVGELGDVLLGRIRGRRDKGEITLFKSLGIAVEDVASARYVYERARADGIGTWISLGGRRETDR
jgi:ornithine cyclodeaminase/alanine dehydrogenase-like protein (mu-crystallin family)